MTLRLKLESVADETDRIRSFTFAAADGGALPGWTAGAHVDFALGDPGARSYSLIGWAGGEAAPATYAFAVQREDGGAGGSRAMHALKVGDEVEAAGPKNDFPVADAPGPALLLAGGIGITPIISMAGALKAAGRPFALHYAARSRGVAAFADRLARDFGATLHCDDETPIDLARLARGAAPGTQIYICGPKGMIDAARAAAEAAGHAAKAIHVELFTTAAPAAGDTPFEVEVKSTGEVFTIPPGKSIIEVLEAAGVDLVYDCQRGDCGICQTDVLEGAPDHRDVVLSEAERAAGDVMQICVSRAKSARLVLDL